MCEALRTRQWLLSEANTVLARLQLVSQQHVRHIAAEKKPMALSRPQDTKRTSNVELHANNHCRYDEKSEKVIESFLTVHPT
jgi:hypothetical protein